MTTPVAPPQGFVWFPWPTGGNGSGPQFPPPFLPPTIPGLDPTRGLTPLDPNTFPPGNGQTGQVPPPEQTPAGTGTFSAAELDVLRQILDNVATARRDARSADKAVAKAGRRRLSVLSAYAVGFLEAKGALQPGGLIANFRPDEGPDFDAAAVELTKVLDSVLESPGGTRFIPVLLAGVIIGILADRAVDNLTS